MFKVFVGLQVIGLCCLCDTVDHSGCLGSVYGINDFPVLLSDAETTDGTLRSLSLYKDKRRYPQDIFILIFLENALKYSCLVVKDEDNIFI